MQRTADEDSRIGEATTPHERAARAVVAYLTASWRQAFRLTTAAHLDRAPVIRRWGVPTLALTNDEKLLGRALSRAGTPLSASDLATRAGLDVRTARDSLKMLGRCGWSGQPPGGHALVADWRQRLGPLGWHFHQVRLDDEPPFNIPCALDFLLLARGAYPERRLTLTDACAHSAAPLRLAIAAGTVQTLEPQGQFDVTDRVSRADLQPGDLVFFAQTYPDPNVWITHVGLYIGDGLMINAPQEGQVIGEQPVFSGFWGAKYAGGGRVRR